MAKPRKQIYTLQMYLQKMMDMDIRSDADVQRMSGAWNNAMMNELVVSVLNGDYIPPVILGQEKNSQAWIIDGLQRSTALMMFRHSNYKVSASVEEPVIAYKAKARDSEGEVKMDGCGDIIWETKEFDIRRKTYKQMPEELKKAFDEYQIKTVIHENYDMQQISRLVRRYNFHKPMNVSQKAFTFCDKYARKIREILKREFFIEAPYSKAERKNGTMERIILESVMVIFHVEDWKKSSQIGAYLNEHSSMEEFAILEKGIERLENIITDGLYPLFTAKNSFLWFALFHRFARLNMDDGKFTEFLYAFQNGLNEKEINGKTFDEIGQERSTKDRSVIMEKLDFLETLMLEYLHVDKENLEETGSTLEFVREYVSQDITQEDIGLYEDMLKDFASKVDTESNLLDRKNHASLIAVIAYSCRKDIKLDEWFMDYFKRNDSYISGQTENYRHMKDDLEEYIRIANAA